MDPAIGGYGFQRKRREVAFGGIGDCAQNRKRDPLLKRVLAGDQAFHIDPGRPCGATQLRLGGGGRDWEVGDGQALDDDARPGAEQALSKRSCDGFVGSDGALV
jgi:hypothetical protein